MSNMDRYTKHITEQVRKGSVVGLRSGIISEAAEVSNATSFRRERKALQAKLGGTTRGGINSTQHGVITDKSPDEVHKHLTSMGYDKTGEGTHGSQKTNKYKKSQDGHNHHITVIGNFERDKTGVQHHG